MTFVLALLLLGAVQSKLPTDADIAARIENMIRTQLHPASVQVVVNRHSPFTTTLQHLDITISGFSTEGLPIGDSASAAADTPPAPVPSPHGDGQQYLVTTSTAPIHPRYARLSLTTASGRQIRIRNAHIICRDFVLKSLPIKELELEIHELCLPLSCVSAGSFAISSIGSAAGCVTLQQQGLTDFIRAHKLPIEQPEVIITPDGCSIKGVYHAALLAVPVEICGRIVAREQAVLALDDPKVIMSGMTLPASITDRLLKGLNPLVDLNADFALPAPVTITQVTHAAGSLRLDAVLNFPPN